MAYVTCAFCGKKIEKKNAYSVKNGKRNKYYCSFEHSIEKNPKEKFYDTAVDVFGKVSNSIFFKDMDELSKVHGYEKMESYLKENKNEIQKYLNKDFVSTYARIKYFRAILANNLDDYEIKKNETKIESDVEFYDIKNVRRNKRIGFDDFFNNLR